MPEQNNTQLRFNRLIEEKKWFQSKDTVVVAVSAGVDSMALLNLITNLPLKLRPEIVVAHVNHHLREQSAVEEKYIREFCGQNSLMLEVGQWSEVEHPKNGIEMAARKFRYDFFSKIMSKHNSRILLTAHHANDQAETVLMRLIRGSFIKDIIGIKESRLFQQGHLIRPLLGFRKKELIELMQKENIKWYEDETNQSMDITRNRIRYELIPFIENENKQGLQHVNHFAQQLDWMKQQNDFYVKHLLKKIEIDDEEYELNKLIDLPYYIQSGVIDYLIGRYVVKGFNQDVVNQIVSLLNNKKKPQGQVRISNDNVLKKEYDKFLIENMNQKPITGFKNNYFVVTLNKWYFDNDIEWMITEKDVHIEGAQRISRFYLLDNEFPLIVQKTQNRDRITLKNGGHQTAKRMFINAKVPIDRRNTSKSLMTDQGKLLAVLGYSESVTNNDPNTKSYTLIIK